MRIRSLCDRASRSDPIRSSESGDPIPDPDPDPMIGSFDPNHDSTGYGTMQSDGRSKTALFPSKKQEVSWTFLEVKLVSRTLNCHICSNLIHQP
jgi:hypothetical protein